MPPAVAPRADGATAVTTRAEEAEQRPTMAMPAPMARESAASSPPAIAAAAQAAPAHALPIAADAREHTAGSSRPTAVDRTSSLDLLSSSPRVRRRTVIVAMKAARSRQNSSGRVARIAPMRGFGPSSP